jgi:hypothetical protein
LPANFYLPCNSCKAFKLFLEIHEMVCLYVVNRNLGTIEHEPLM